MSLVLVIVIRMSGQSSVSGVRYQESRWPCFLDKDYHMLFHLGQIRVPWCGRCIVLRSKNKMGVYQHRGLECQHEDFRSSRWIEQLDGDLFTGCSLTSDA